jgi:hypothetical protein
LESTAKKRIQRLANTKSGKVISWESKWNR